MRNLWVFGDSFSIPFSSDFPWCQNYCKFKGYTPKTYSEIIAEDFNLKLCNRAIGGCDNNTIIEQFALNSMYMTPEDIVIVGWTSPIRYRLFSEKLKGWQIINTTNTPLYLEFEMISKQTVEEILINRGNSIYVNELNNLQQLLHFSLRDYNHAFWRWSDVMGKTYLESIHTETNGLIQDSHFSESSHKKIAEMLIDELGLKNNLKYA